MKSLPGRACPNIGRRRLRRPFKSGQAYALHQVNEARIRAKRVELRLRAQPDQPAIPYLERPFEPFDRAIHIPEAGVNESKVVWRGVVLSGMLCQFSQHLPRL